MPKCDLCGNEYDKAFRLTIGETSYTFDSFECAIEKVAPRCIHCGCRIIGHGMEKGGNMYCCAHCAGTAGAPEMRDRG